MARILYGVQGEGRGHATRSLRVLQALIREGHDVLVFTGGDALPVLAPALGNRVVDVPLLRYHYDHRSGALSPWRTIVRGAGAMLRMAVRNHELRETVRRFGPAAAISDFEPLTCRMARLLRLPLVAVDHQHFLTEARLPRFRRLRDRLMLQAYRLGTHLLSGWPRRIIVSSFHHFPRRRGSRAVFVGPFLPEDVRALAPRDDGHVTVYLKRPHALARLLPVFAARPDRTFEVFSDWAREWSEPIPRNVVLHPVSRAGFLGSLASCHAVITTAGNQVLGEAAWLGKPALALPETGVLEQALNARALEAGGCGMACAFEDFDGGVWDWFEAGREGFLRSLRAFRERHPRYDGLEATLRVIRRMAGVTGAPVVEPAPATVPAS